MKMRIFLVPALGWALACGNTLVVTYDDAAPGDCNADRYLCAHTSSSSSSGTNAIAQTRASLFTPQGETYNAYAAASDADHLYVTAVGASTDLTPVSRLYVYDRVGTSATLTGRVDLAAANGAPLPSAVSVVGGSVYVLAAGKLTRVVRDGTTLAWTKQEQVLAPDVCTVQASPGRVVTALGDGRLFTYDTSLGGAALLARVDMFFPACPSLAVSDARVAAGSDSEVLVVDGDATAPRHFADRTPKSPHNVALVGDRVAIARAPAVSTDPAVAVYDVSGEAFVPVADISAALAAHVPRISSCASAVCQLRATSNGLVLGGSTDLIALSFTATGAVSAVNVSPLLGTPLTFDDDGAWLVPAFSARQVPGLVIRRYDVGADNGLRPNGAALLPNPVKPSLLYDTVFVAALDDNLYASSGDSVARYVSDGASYRAVAVTFPQPGAAIDKLAAATDGARELYASVHTEAGEHRVLRGVPGSAADAWTWSIIGTCRGGDWAALHTRVVCFGETPGLVRMLETTGSGIVERTATTRAVDGQRVRVALTRDRIVISAGAGGGEVLSIDDDARLGVIGHFLPDETITDQAVVDVTRGFIATQRGVFALALTDATTRWLYGSYELGTSDVTLAPVGASIDAVSLSNKYSTFGPLNDTFIGTHPDAVRGPTWAAVTDGQVLNVYTLLR